MSKLFLGSLALIILASEAIASGAPPQVTVTSSPIGTQINTLPSSNPAGTSDTVAFPIQGVTGGVPVNVVQPSGSIVTGQASLTVGPSSGNVALGSNGPVVQVYNPGAAVVYVKLGVGGAITAATTDTPVAPGSYAIFNTNGTATYLAAIAPTGTPTLSITSGVGSPLGWGGGSGGGSVTISQVTPGTTNGVYETAPANWGVSQVSVGSTATSLVSSRAVRQAVVITNLGTTNIYLGGSGVTTSTGALLPGVIGASKTITTSGAVYGIVSAGSQTVSIEEMY